MCEQQKQVIEFYGIGGMYGFLSNFYGSIFELQGQQWPSVEHCYQASKAVLEEDRKKIASAETAAIAKKLGKVCQCRKDWDQLVGTPALHRVFSDTQGVVVERTKDHIMFAALVAKFTQRRELHQALFFTGNTELIECSPFDYYWGIGKDRAGLNKLGRMLQLVRSRLS